MSEAIAPRPSLMEPLTDPAGGAMMDRVRRFTAQPAIRKTLPWFGGVAAIGLLALTWAVMSPDPQRVLYNQLNDTERADVVAALDQAAIPYTIDNTSGALTVAEQDLYRARMVVASNGALATPETGSAMLDNLPMGASRALEGERMRAAKERDLELTIAEIDGIQSVRVHLAEAEKSVFVRDNAPPKASVMVRMASGRQLSDSQVMAIANLVAGSVPNLPNDAVQIVDQHGRLLSDRRGEDNDRLSLQSRMEAKLREQLERLLTPMLGAGNFSSEIQVDLDMAETTSARESYDKEGVVRREDESQTRSSAPGAAMGVPGATSNTPPPPTQAQDAPPQGTQPAAGAATPVNDQSNVSRTYELGREVAVSNIMPGNIRRLSVAVALSAEAMKKAKPAEIQKLQELVSAAVGANAARGDTVAVVVRPFEPVDLEGPAFYEAPWFAPVLRYGAALLGLLLVLLLVVRPMLRTLKEATTPVEERDELAVLLEPVDESQPPKPIDQETLNRQIGYLQRLVDEKPDRAVLALREMLEAGEPAPGTEAEADREEPR